MRNIGTIIGSTFWKAERSMRIMQVPSAFFGTSPQGVQQDRPDRQRNEMGIEHRNHQHIAKWSFLVFPPYPTIQCNTGEYVWPIIPMFVPLPKKNQLVRWQPHLQESHFPQRSFNGWSLSLTFIITQITYYTLMSPIFPFVSQFYIVLRVVGVFFGWSSNWLTQKNPWVLGRFHPIIRNLQFGVHLVFPRSSLGV